MNEVAGRKAGQRLPAHVGDVDLKVLDLQADLPWLERWLRSPHVVRWWGTPDLAALVRRPEDTHAVIMADRRPAGYLCWQKPFPAELEAAGLTDLPGDLVDIDIMIGEPELLGRGLGPRALALLLTKLRGEGVGFAGLGTSASNRVAIRAFEKAGFRLFREFEDPELGACKYMVARIRTATDRIALSATLPQSTANQGAGSRVLPGRVDRDPP